MNLGNTIKSLRKAKNLKQGSFAESCGISATYLSLIEANEKEPNISVLKRIAENLNVPLPIIFFLSIENSDIKSKKQEAFKVLAAPVKSMISEIFATND